MVRKAAALRRGDVQEGVDTRAGEVVLLVGVAHVGDLRELEVDDTNGDDCKNIRLECRSRYDGEGVQVDTSVAIIWAAKVTRGAMCVAHRGPVAVPALALGSPLRAGGERKGGRSTA